MLLGRIHCAFRDEKTSLCKQNANVENKEWQCASCLIKCFKCCNMLCSSEIVLYIRSTTCALITLRPGNLWRLHTLTVHKEPYLILRGCSYTATSETQPLVSCDKFHLCYLLSYLRAWEVNLPWSPSMHLPNFTLFPVSFI